MEKLISYKNDPTLKDMLVREIENHREQDQIIQGSYGKGEGKSWKGCAVGCAIHSINKKLNKDYSTSDHTVYETELGIPEWLARLEDMIFEGLSKEEAKTWPERFAKAIPVGVDLDPLKWKFCAFILKGNIDRVLALTLDEALKKQVVDSVRGVLNLHETAITTGKWDESAAAAARSAAAAAARSAASAAWSASAWSASAWSASASARSAARSAAWSAAASAAARSAAARSAAYQDYAKELLRLISEAK